MEIIKHGKQKRIHFHCPSCGCEFFATAKECECEHNYGTLKFNSFIIEPVDWKAKCPKCNFMCTKEEDIQYEKNN